MVLGFMDYEVASTVWQEQEAREAGSSVAPAMDSAHSLKPTAALGTSDLRATNHLESVTQSQKLSPYKGVRRKQFSSMP